MTGNGQWATATMNNERANGKMKRNKWNFVNETSGGSWADDGETLILIINWNCVISLYVWVCAHTMKSQQTVFWGIRMRYGHMQSPKCLLTILAPCLIRATVAPRAKRNNNDFIKLISLRMASVDTHARRRIHTTSPMKLTRAEKKMRTTSNERGRRGAGGGGPKGIMERALNRVEERRENSRQWKINEGVVGRATLIDCFLCEWVSSSTFIEYLGTFQELELNPKMFGW